MTRAMTIQAFGDPGVLQLGDVPLGPVGDDDLLLRVAFAAVNPVDLGTRAGRDVAADAARFPMVLGWDAAGTVEQAGGNAGLEAGDRVAVLAIQVVDQRGTYADRAVVSAAGAAPVPDGLDLATAAAVPLAGQTAAQGLGRLRLTAGDTLVVNGATGALGRFALQLAARAGVTVVAVARAEDEPLARSLGAAALVDRDADVAAAVHDVLGGPADAAFDLVGGRPAHALLAAVRDGGRYVTAVPKRVDPSGPFAPARLIEPKPVYVRPDRAQLAELLRLVADGELQVPVAHRLPLAEAARAHELVARGGLRGKVVLETGAG